MRGDRRTESALAAGWAAMQHGRTMRRRARYALDTGASQPRIVIVGAGPGGLCAAIRLRDEGYTDLTIVDANDGPGGTWHANTYPGAACDVPSHLYSFSFASKADWTRRFAQQGEILEYYRQLVDEYSLAPLIRYGTRVDSMRWNESERRWYLDISVGSTTSDSDTDTGDTADRARGESTDQLIADVVIAACGQLSAPHVPDLPGLDTFDGEAFHSARWRHDVDLRGRRVAVVGNGASAVQFLPPVAESADSVVLFQRSANWILPKPDGEYPDWFRALMGRVPLLQRLYRWSIFLRLESRVSMMGADSRLGRFVRKMLTRELRKLVDADLPENVLVPDYPVGCKRILISDDYYLTLKRPNVSVSVDRVDRIESDAIVAVSPDGTEHRHEVDAVIFGTGFKSTEFLTPMAVRGIGGQLLADEWRDGAHAVHGVSVTGFPNLFLLYGPNTNLGHNSILFMIEAQLRHVVAVLNEARVDRRPDSMVSAEAYRADDDGTQDRVRRSVWVAGCDSWYRTAEGRVTNNLPGSTIRYWWVTHGVRPGDYIASSPSVDPHGAAGDHSDAAIGGSASATFRRTDRDAVDA